MDSIDRKIRWLVTSGLIVCLGVSGLFPQTVAWAEHGTRGAVSQRSTKCCCGTEDGRCCGKGCCMARRAPAEERCPCPNPRDTRGGQNHLLALAPTETRLVDGGEAYGSCFGHPETGAGRSPSESSLQAKHIRIDI